MCENSGYTTGVKTDHLAYYAFFLIKAKPRGHGYWKMNTKYLRTEKFVTLMNKTIDEANNSQCNKATARKKWEYIKYKIRDVSREFPKEQAGELSLLISQLSEKVNEMEMSLETVNKQILEDTKIDLDTCLQEKTKECIFRIKSQIY